MMSEADVRANAAASSADLATTTISPVRIVDTRPGAGSLGGTKVPWGALETRTVEAAGLGSIPDDAVGVVVNVTALNATAPETFLTLFPTGSAMPNASTLNPSPNEVSFNAATVLLGPDGTFEIYNYSGTVDVIIDVTAYLTRALADNVDELETSVDSIDAQIEEVSGISDDLAFAYLPYLVDADGNSFAYAEWGSQYVYSDGGWYGISSLRFGARPSIYFEASDCTGQGYHMAVQADMSAYDTGFPYGPTGILSLGGPVMALEYGEVSDLHPYDMGSQLVPQSATTLGGPMRCDTYVYPGGDDLVPVTGTALEVQPKYPITIGFRTLTE